MSADEFWRRCSGCKKEIGFDETYWVCSVSTCNRKRTGMFFCSVSCWEAHLPMMRHREAYAVEKRSPSAAAWQRAKQEETARAEPEPGRVETTRNPAAARRKIAPRPRDDDELPRDILIVVSKLKKYIKARSGMNTSDAVTGVLSDHVRRLCDQAIRTAAEDGRKTVLDRDFPPVR
jgi:histone H3/H4